jgi:hypothetical protein
MLSGRYPFFDSSDDITSLCEVIVLCGSAEIAEGALAVGKRLHTSVDCPKQDLRQLCEKYVLLLGLIGQPGLTSFQG